MVSSHDRFPMGYPGPSRSPNLVYPPTGLNPSMPRQQVQTDNRGNSAIDVDSLVQKARLEARSAKESDVRGKSNTAEGRIVPSIQIWPVQSHSRLPTDSAPRKAPRKSVSDHRSTPRKAPQKSVNDHHSSPAQKYASRLLKEKSKKPPRKTITRGKQPRKSSHSPTTSKPTSLKVPAPRAFRRRHLRVILDEDDEFESRSARSARSASMETCVTTLDQSYTEPSSPQKCGNPQARVQIRGPRPRNEYPVPEKLEGFQQALGPENWYEYLVLMENLWIGDITGEEFAAKTKRIFMMFNDKFRKRVNNLMAMEVVQPVLERRTQEEANRKNKK